MSNLAMLFFMVLRKTKWPLLKLLIVEGSYVLNFQVVGGKSLEEQAFADYATDAHNSLIQSNTLKLSMPSCYNCISAQGYYS